MLKLLATILVLSFCHVALGQLSARFSADLTAGCGPLVVHFTNQSTGAGGAASWQWDLGNGNLAAVADPVATYIQPGNYTVVLTVKDGPQTSTYTQEITVYQPPAATFTVSNPKVCSPAPVNFSASATPGSGAIAGYLWDFGDGSTQTVNSASTAHAYQPPGVYTVSLTVTDVHGCAATAMQADAVTVLAALLPSFTTSPQVLCTVNSPVTFTNMTTGPGTLSYQWNFGDGGGGSTATSPTYTYGAKGTYTVILTATSSVGCSAADTQTNVLNVANFNTNFTVPASVCQGAAATFTDSSSPTPTAETWTVDGTAAGAGMTLSQAFAAAGNHTIALTNTYGACTQSATHTFTVNAAPVMPPFDAVQQSACGAPMTVNFLDHTPGAVSWLWAFDYNPFATFQNYTSGGPAISTVYGENMNWPVQLTVTNAQGCQASELQTVSVSSPYATIGLVAGTPSVCGQPMTETFGSAQIGNLTSWEWIFGDGDSTNAPSPTHTFSNPGHYETFLRWTDKNGCSGVSNILYTNITPPFTNIDFTADATTVCVGQGVSFTGSPNMATDNAILTSWNFGDGSTFGFAPTSAWHAYTVPGIYTVILNLASAGNCTATITKADYITVLPSPTISFTTSNICDSPRTAIDITPAAGNGATGVQWDFGDGTGQNTAANIGSVAHTYGANGEYNIVATATNGGCTATAQSMVTIELKPLSFNLSVSATTICPATFITDNLQKYYPPENLFDYGAFDNVQWYYGDGTPFLGPQNWVAISGTGTYSSMLSGFQAGETGLYAVTTNTAGCKDTSNLVPLQVGGVTAAYQINQDDQCYQQPVILQDVSRAAPGDPISSWLWNFGDGTTSAASGTVQHLYVTPGDYTVTLTVTDQNGCSSTSASAASQVTVNGPLASFATATGGTVFPQGATIQFANNSNTANTTSPVYTWTFGDGGSSNQADPSYTYATPGNYTVTLTATDAAGGCTSVARLTLTIQPVNNAFTKTASYVASGSCPPVLVQFTNLSVNYSSYSWDFGDGETVSNVANPSHVYQHPGTYIVKLTVVGNNGQSTTTVDSVIVAQPAAVLSAAVPAICQGQSVTLQSTGNIRVKTYAWDFGDGTVVSSPDSTVSHAYPTAGMYQAKLVVTDSLGCSTAAAAVDPIDVHAPPVVDVSPATALVCLGKSVGLKAIGGQSFSWSPGSTLDDSTIAAPVAAPAANTEYTVTITDNIGCTNTDSVAVRIVRPDTVRVNPDSAAICPGKEVPITATGAYSYQWVGVIDGLSATNVPNPVAAPSATAVYTVAGADSAGCFRDTASVTVTLLPQPTVNAGPDIQVLGETPVTIPAIGGADVVSWQWMPPTDLSCTDCAQPVCTPRQSQQYIVIVTAADGCMANDTVLVQLACDEAKVRIPDAFTPNGDGHNDRFTVLGAISMVNHLVIFDRWGTKVFEADHFYPADPNSGWDGTLHGQPSPPDVYVYYAEMQCPAGGVFTRKGTVVLVR